MSRLNVLLSAYACRPNMGSEPGVGWHMACAIAQHHQVWALTRADNRPFIEAELALNPVANLQFVYCDLPASRHWKRGAAAVHGHYYLWQLAAYQAARRLHRQVGFDVAHHVTYVRHSVPSFLALLPIPLVWGPVGGGESAPAAFAAEFDAHGKTYETLRHLLRWVGEHDPFVALTARRSQVALATTVDTAQRLAHLGAVDPQVQSQVGLSAAELATLAQLPSPSAATLRFLSVGRLLHWKGFHLGLRAFAQADLPKNAEYLLVGDGREQLALQQLAEELGIAPAVKFLGNLPREQVLSTLGQCHALVHPSLHESGGFVCIEAMAAGRPVLCLDLGGPAVQVTPQTGFAVAAQSPQQAVEDLALAMTRLAQDPGLRLSLGQAARQRATDTFAWSARGQYYAQLYQGLCRQPRVAV